jgi:hypothetical protein
MWFISIFFNIKCSIFVCFLNQLCLFVAFLQLFFPIVDSSHWFLFTVDFEYKLFAFMDSFHDKESNFHRRMRDTLVSVWIMFFLDYILLCVAHVPISFSWFATFFFCMQIDNFIHLWELIISKEHEFGEFKVMYPYVLKQKNCKF